MLSEHRYQCLLLQFLDLGVAPGEYRIVCDVHQAHGAAGVLFAGSANRDRPAVGERQFLLVATGARCFAIYRHSSVVEEVSTQFYLRRRHWIVGGNAWLRKTFG